MKKIIYRLLIITVIFIPMINNNFEIFDIMYSIVHAEEIPYVIWRLDQKRNFENDFLIWQDIMNQTYLELISFDNEFVGENIDYLMSVIQSDDFKIAFNYYGNIFARENIQTDWVVFDVISIYKSINPYDEHLYFFCLDQSEDTKVLYLSSNEVYQGTYKIKITENIELRKLFDENIISEEYSFMRVQDTLDAPLIPMDSPLKRNESLPIGFIENNIGVTKVIEETKEIGTREEIEEIVTTEEIEGTKETEVTSLEIIRREFIIPDMKYLFSE